MAAFDIEPPMDLSECGKPIYSINRLEHFCKHYNVQIGVIAVPVEDAQAVCNTLVSNGIRAIWNFAPVHLRAPKHVLVQNENLAASLSSLQVRMKRMSMEVETEMKQMMRE